MEVEKKIHRSPLARLALRTALARTVAISLVAVVIIFGALSVQMALGSDPALGPKAKAAATPAGDDSYRSTSVLGSVTPVQPVQTQVAPVQTQVAPAPAPTPVQTSTS